MKIKTSTYRQEIIDQMILIIITILPMMTMMMVMMAIENMAKVVTMVVRGDRQ